jgi:protein-disulfide isomerase
MATLELAVAVEPTDHSLGHRHASVILVEYGDFECPHCKQAAPVVRHLAERFPLHLRVVFRHFPLTEVHANALRAALAAEAAAAQNKFWPMHDLLFANQQHFGAAHLRHYAQRLELDLARFDADMADTVYLQRVREHIAGGHRSGVRATPTFFVSGEVVDVSYGLQALQRRVEAEVLACEGPTGVTR